MEPAVGGHWMLNQLMTAVLAGALALATSPTFALDLPDTGSKNFSPGNDTPTHFANERVPVSARIADTTAGDFSAEEAAAPMPSVARPSASAHPRTARHSAQKSTKHISRKGRGHNHSARAATVNSGRSVRTASAYHFPAQARTAGKRPASVGKSARVAGARSGARSVTPSGAKTVTAKHSEAGASHAWVAAPYPKEA
jgi:hypothetical protein